MSIINYSDKFTVNEPAKENNKIKQWFVKHNKVMAVLVAHAVFFLIIGIVMYKGTTDDGYEVKQNPSTPKVLKKLLSFSNGRVRKNYAADADCTVADKIVCKGGTINSAIEWLNQNSDLKKMFHITLELENVEFPNNVLAVENFEDLQESLDLASIEFRNCMLQDIKDEAFSKRLSSLVNLVVNNCKVKKLRKEMFSGLSSLSSLEIRFFEGHNVFFVEPCTLFHLKALEILQIDHSTLTKEVLDNLFGAGCVISNKLLLIDLRANIIDELGPKSFLGTPNLMSLYLTDSSLSKIDIEAFVSLRNMRLLYMDQNVLRTLPEGVFDAISASLSNVSLGNNPWECKCPLQWLKDFYLSRPEIIMGEPPKCDNYKDFEEVEFCNDIVTDPTTTPSVTDVTTNTAITTTSTTDATVTSPSPESVEVDCLNVTGTEMNIDTNSRIEQMQLIKIVINKQVIKLGFYEIDQEPFMLLIRVIEGDVSQFVLSWHNAKQEDEFGCDTALQKDIYVENLTRGSTYTFCLLQDDDDNKIYTPFNCMGLSIPESWPERAWVRNKSIVAVASGLSVGLLLTTVLSVLIAYICIRKYPKLIKGNKNIVIIKKTTGSQPQMVLPQEFDRPVYIAPSVITYDPGYLTPNFHKYSRVKYRPPVFRGSVVNEIGGYIEAEGPSRLELEHWRQNSRMGGRKCENNPINEISEYDEIPPPVPDGHPSGWHNNKVNVNVLHHDNLYSSA